MTVIDDRYSRGSFGTVEVTFVFLPGKGKSWDRNWRHWGVIDIKINTRERLVRAEDDMIFEL